jgi:predicted ArsR family transcriptional regulator
MSEERTIVPTARQLRALAHPVRLRMLGMLRMEGPATSTSLAQRLGLNTGATSYHLRQLAEHGFIEDDPTQGSGRERWWKASYTSTRTELGSRDDSDDPDVIDAYLQTVVTVYTEQLQRAIEERPLLPARWREATTFSDWQHRVTPERARELIDRFDEILTGIEDDDDPAAATVTFNVNVFPRPGALGEDSAS